MRGERINYPNEEIEYRYYDDSGDANLTVRNVFEGVDIIFNSVHMNACDLAAGIKGRLIEVHHCREGRLEHQHGNELVYMMPGDLSISRRNQAEDICHFPLRHYHGITIVINEEIAPKCFSRLMKDVDVKPAKIADRLCGEDGCFVIRNEEYIEHLFSELYSVPVKYKKAYYKVKIMELFLVLSWIDPKDNGIVSVSLSKTQVQLAKEAAKYLSMHLDERITQEKLAGIFHVSRAHLCSAFKGVYGVPIYKYVRIQKIQTAALQLIHTDRTVIDIAIECGYDNPSKFSSAFKEIMGETPLDYRKAHTVSI